MNQIELPFEQTEVGVEQVRLQLVRVRLRAGGGGVHAAVNVGVHVLVVAAELHHVQGQLTCLPNLEILLG